MDNTREKGAESEALAADFLKKNGYQVLAMNWFHHHHEIDIIARKKDIVAIVEVRSLTRNYFQEPYQSVNKNKQRTIISAANAYIRSHNIEDEVRFDIISIVKVNGTPQIEHIEGAFYPLIHR
jgi:putative endonuclease